MADLLLEDLGKTFASGVRALDEISLEVASGECLALVGPSGCGKTTLLRLIAGLEQATEGNIHIDGVNVNGTPCHRREVALLQQRPAFMLEQTVRQNLRLAWTMGEPLAPVRRWLGADREREGELTRLAHLLDLDTVLDRPVQQLSGGQLQRVALGRCLLRKAKITLLDEPLGHLDAPLRTDLRRQIRMLARELGLTILHVTHDPAEALAIGDRVVVMERGRILQVDTPKRMRRAPAHRIVAELIHHEDGGFNWLAGAILRQEFDAFFEGAFGRWPVSLLILDHLRESLYKGEDSTDGNTPKSREIFGTEQGKVHIMMGIPASNVRCTTAARVAEDEIRIDLTIRDTECEPAGTWVLGEAQQGRWIGRADEAEPLERCQEIAMAFSMSRAYWFDAATGRTLYAPTS